jgi:hypothetical protein
MIELGITSKQRENLRILAEGLERQVPPPEFDMSGYMHWADDTLVLERYIVLTEEEQQLREERPWDFCINEIIEPTPEFYRDPECKTVACAAGHGPLFGIKKWRGENWTEYSHRVFTGHNWILWNWLFDGQWAGVDNTPKGAAARIRYALAHGVPDNAKDQRYGDAPLCYVVEGE